MLLVILTSLLTLLYNVHSSSYMYICTVVSLIFACNKPACVTVRAEHIFQVFFYFSWGRLQNTYAHADKGATPIDLR